MRLTRVLGGILFFTSLLNPSQALPGVTVTWDPSLDANLTGYAVYYGTNSGSHQTRIEVGRQTNATIQVPSTGVRYFFVAIAYTVDGVESLPSNEISYRVPNNLPTLALISPFSGASYTAPAIINLAADVTADGYTIAKVEFYNGDTRLGEGTSSPYGWTWSNVGPGSYSLTARALYGDGSILNSSPVNITVMGLPAPWQKADIGGVGEVGNASLSNGIYTVEGAGNISGTADNYRFVFQPLSGDGEIKVRLNSMANTGPSGRIGVMIRESLTQGSRYAFMGVSPGGTFRWQHRGATSGSTSSDTSSSGTPPDVWMRLVRTGNTLYGYSSTNGASWRLVNSDAITMARNIYVGLAVASGTSNRLNPATFINMTVVP